MGKDEHSKVSSRHKHDKGGDKDKKHKKRRKHDDDEGDRKHKHRRKGSDSKLKIVDDDPNDEDMWVEKNIDMDGERVLATDIPTALSLKLTSSAADNGERPSLPPATTSESKIQRDEWMLLPPSIPTVPADTPTPSRPTTLPLVNDDTFTDGYGEPSTPARTLGGGVDFFSSLGTARERKPRPDQINIDKPTISLKELNRDLLEGKSMDVDETVAPKSFNPGGPGSQWRMMRLRKVYETAEEEGLPIEKVAMDRFGSLEAFEEAKEEKRILDEREGKRGERDRGRNPNRPSRDGEKRLMFTDIGGSGGSSRSSSFRRPGAMGDSTPATPTMPLDSERKPANRRLDSLRLPSQAVSPLAQSHTPIPSVMTPPVASGSKTRALSPSSLNRLQAKVLRAKLMGAADADKLEREYEAEARKANGSEDVTMDGGVKKKVEVLPTLDARGRLYDVGHGKNDEVNSPGNRKKKEKAFETHDRKTGEVIRINPDDDTMTLGEMLRQERFGAGMADQKDLDAQYARAIMGDGKFQNDLDYIDDNAEKLSRQKMRSDAMKRQFAIHDYKRTQKALASCHFCYGEDDSPPRAPVIAMGTRVYLSCTLNDELVKGHCLIVPIQHHLTMLEGDDDVWDEIQNFMKCLMRMFAEDGQGVVFYETVISLRKQLHTFIECVPLPAEQFEVIPGYFKESIMTSEAEWSQHKKLIDFSKRPGGFRRAMVPNLPYFMVQFDYKGDKGYGHVIEGAEEADGDGDENVGDEGAKGGGEFPRYFAGEIIGNLLELEPRRWRRPKRIDFHSNKERVGQFKRKYDRYDWTGMIGR